MQYIRRIIFIFPHLVMLVMVFLGGNKVCASQRAAMVIGNSAYGTCPLANPTNDAKAMSIQLASLKFQVESYYDLTQQAMYDAIDRFFTEHGQATELMFYYAGHAIQVNGRNYLIPVDTPFTTEDILSRLFDLRYLTDKLTALTKTRIKILVLDACRNNPFSTISQASSGLAEITAPVGTIIAFSTAPGQTAVDGDGPNSPYTTSLACAMSQPGGKIEDIFKQVRTKVKEMTAGKQIPWEATSLEEDFYFIPPITPKDPAETMQKRDKPLQKATRIDTCNRLMTKLSLGMEELNHEEQLLLQSSCR